MRNFPGRLKLAPPNDEKRILLHSCCAPCSGSIMETLADSGIELTVFFYNPNIYPQKEYEIRKKENIRFARKLNVPFIDGDYETDEWLKRVKGLEGEPERGKRCTACFDMRLERTALWAVESGFKVFATSLGISRWKDMDQVNDCAMRAALRYPDLIYWAYNWRKNGGTERKQEVIKRENFYQQQYCGCIYSLQNANIERLKRGKQRIPV